MHEHLETDRLLLRRPRPTDAVAIFGTYASDPAVTHYLGWPRHQTLADTETFLAFSEAAWQQHGVGPYLIESRAGGHLLGSTGLAVEAPGVAQTGYVLAQQHWRRGYATEALQAMIHLAPTLALYRVYALCHPDHRASQRVLEKCGFVQKALLPQHCRFPNLYPDALGDAVRYGWEATPETSA